MSYRISQLYVDGNLVIDNWTRQRRGEEFFTAGSQEERGVFELKANTKHNVFVEFCNVRSPADGDEDEAVMDSNPGVRLGGAELVDEDEEMAKAVRLAQEADLVIAIVGLNADWETEGYDRTTLALPRRTDELVQKVAEANPKTIVVTQSVRSIPCTLIECSFLIFLVGVVNRNAMGRLCRSNCSLVVPGQFHGRCDRRHSPWQEKSIRKAFFDFPKAHGRYSIIWPFPL